MRILTKRGFTIAEFIVSIMFMFLIIGAAVSIPMKKAKETKHNKKQDGVKMCSCNSDENKTSIDTCILEFEPSGRFEFYTVQILGGGAAGMMAGIMLAEKGYSPSFGARPLRRVLQKKIEDPIAEEILTGHYKHNDTIKLALHEDMIVFSSYAIQVIMSFMMNLVMTVTKN